MFVQTEIPILFFLQTFLPTKQLVSPGESRACPASLKPPHGELEHILEQGVGSLAPSKHEGRHALSYVLVRWVTSIMKKEGRGGDHFSFQYCPLLGVSIPSLLKTGRANCPGFCVPRAPSVPLTRMTGHPNSKSTTNPDPFRSFLSALSY